MADSRFIPGSHSKPLNPDGSWRGEWWRFLRDLANQPGTSNELATGLNALAARVQTLEDADPSNLVGLLSVFVQGNQLSLRGDVSAPGEGFYYGTNDAGTKGWYERLLATLNDVDLVTTPPDDGDVLTWDAAAEKWVPAPGSGGGGSAEGGILIQFGAPSDESPVLPVGTKAQAIASASYELNGEWELWCYPSGSVQVDVWVDDFASLPPTDADSICPGDEPAVAASISATGSFTGPVTVNRTDGVTANIDSNTGVKWVSLLLKGTKTA